MILKLARRNAERQGEASRLFGQVWQDRVVSGCEPRIMDLIGRMLVHGAHDGQEVAESHRVADRIETVGISQYLDEREGRQLLDFVTAKAQRDAQRRAKRSGAPKDAA